MPRPPCASASTSSSSSWPLLGFVSAVSMRTAEVRGGAGALRELLLDLVEDALACLAALLLGADLAQVGLVEVLQAGLDLRDRQLLVGRDRGPGNAGAAPDLVGLGERALGGVACRAA